MAEQSTIGSYNTMSEIEEAIDMLDKGGFPIKQVSIVTQNIESEKEVQGYVTTGDVAKTGAGTGAWIGGLFGLLVGAAFLWIPGFGPLVVAGSFASMLVGSMEGAAVGAAGGGLLGSLVGWGVSKQHILKYEEELKAGKYLLIAHGSSEEVGRAQSILQSSGTVNLKQHAEAGA
jgi:uncharacterized membrane protein